MNRYVALLGLGVTWISLSSAFVSASSPLQDEISMSAQVLENISKTFLRNDAADINYINDEKLLSIFPIEEFEKYENTISASEELNSETSQVSPSSHVINTREVVGYKSQKETGNICLSVPVKTHSGYIEYNSPFDTGKEKLFFWLHESQNDPEASPLVIWLNGGPGCSSMLGMFTELGPCTLTANNDFITTVPNKFSWNNNTNLLFIDQPIGAGLSGPKKESSPTSTFESSEHLHSFLRAFYEDFPQYKTVPLHITGESYAGHYIPGLAKQIIEHNATIRKSEACTENPQSSDCFEIPLKTLMIGNPLVDREIQTLAYAEFALDPRHGPLISETRANEYQQSLEMCMKLADRTCKRKDLKSKSKCNIAKNSCWSSALTLTTEVGVSVYDIREKCTQGSSCKNDKNTQMMETYLNSSQVQDALGLSVKYKTCNTSINLGFSKRGDGRVSYITAIEQILQNNIPVLIYAGDADFICNWVGNLRWVKALNWKDAPSKDSPLEKWSPDDSSAEAGEVYDAGILKFIRVYDAGHMVPEDQPEVSLKLFNKWIFASDYQAPLAAGKPFSKK